MFSVPKQGRHPDAFKSRKDCFIEAAQHIFTLEDDPAIHCEISKDATRVATAIGNRVKRWVSSCFHNLNEPHKEKIVEKKYQLFNIKLGSKVSILKYESIEPGSDAHQKIGMWPFLRSRRCTHTPGPESLSLWFPFWKELHKHWRTLPHYNEFWDGGPRANLVDRHIPKDPPQKGTSGRSRAPSKKLLLSNGGEHRYPTGSNSQEARKM